MNEHLPLVRSFMTPLPHTVALDQSCRIAAERMRQLGVRHMPVADGGALVGLIAADRLFADGRSGDRASSSKALDPDKITAGDVMISAPYVVGPEMPLYVVVREMARRREDCAVVVDGGHIEGILTTVDALDLLADLLASRAPLAPRALRPSEVRGRIRDEHRVLRKMLDEAESLAEQVLAGDRSAEPTLYEHMRDLYQTFLRHIMLENTILVPALLESGAYGKERADALLREHARQQEDFRGALASVEHDAPQRVARAALLFAADVRLDMEHEERKILIEGVLSDDPIRTDIFTG
jgi:CBS domain-containing protein